MHRLQNTVRHYAWGSTSAIAGALGVAESGEPEAELWIGAHPDSPSVAQTASGPLPLTDLIAADPRAALGPDLSQDQDQDQGQLPFLMKLLAADAPLSLQVHPSRSQAQAGFAAEEAAGVDRTAADRNYKDQNHKPEMILALTSFDALCGFRPLDEAAADFSQLAQRTGNGLLDAVANDLVSHDGLHKAFTRLIEAGDAVAPAVSAAVAGVGGQHVLSRALRTLLDLAEQYPADPGTLISLLLNRVHLQPGQAVSMPAGNVHAYLSGLGVEVMASSDNVLRGGLTSKHIDVPELLKLVDFSPLPVPLVTPIYTGLGQEVFDPGFEDFVLQRIQLSAEEPEVALLQNGPLLVLVLDGAVYLDSPRGDLALGKGESAFALADEAPVNAHLAEGAQSGLAFAVTAGSSRQS